MLTREGIVIKTIKYQETSKIAFILSENGINSYLVRNANNYKSKNFSYSQELIKLSFDVAKKENKKDSFEIITSGKVLDNYSNIKNDIDALLNSIEILEIIYSLSMHTNDNHTLYSFLSKILDLINKNIAYRKLYCLIFKTKLLYLLGIAPNFSHCSKCQTKEDLYSLQLDSGTSLCKKCFSLNEAIIYGKSYNILRFLYLTKVEQFDEKIIKKIIEDEKSINDINEFLDRYYDYYLGYKSQTKKIANKIKNN